MVGLFALTLILELLRIIYSEGAVAKLLSVWWTQAIFIWIIIVRFVDKHSEIAVMFSNIVFVIKIILIKYIQVSYQNTQQKN